MRILAIALSLAAAPALADLRDLARHVPATARDAVLIDVAAGRTTVLAGWGDEVLPDLQLYGFFPMPPVPGVDLDSIFVAQDALPEIYGFGLGDIDGIAGWGQPPAGVAVLTGDGVQRAVADGGALAAAGFQMRDGVWWLHADNHVSPMERRDDLFGGRLGASVRLAPLEGAVAVARSWPVIEAARAPQARLADSAVGQALLGLVKLPYGRPLFLARLDVPDRDVAVIGWADDGATVTGALISLHLGPAGAAQEAADMTAMLESGVSLMTNAPFAELLPGAEVLTLEVAGRHAALMVQTNAIDPAEDGPLTMTISAAWRFMRMHAALDLPLVGARPDIVRLLERSPGSVTAREREALGLD